MFRFFSIIKRILVLVILIYLVNISVLIIMSILFWKCWMVVFNLLIMRLKVSLKIVFFYDFVEYFLIRFFIDISIYI